MLPRKVARSRARQARRRRIPGAVGVLLLLAALPIGASIASRDGGLFASLTSVDEDHAAVPTTAVPTTAGSTTAGLSSPGATPGAGASSPVTTPPGGKLPAVVATGATGPTASMMLAGLTVRAAGPASKYTAARFGPTWFDVDHNGCDSRDDTLLRDLTSVTVRAGSNGCWVLTGTLADPYAGRTLSYLRGRAPGTAVGVDHVVGLADAWRKGARSWPPSRGLAFANDPLNLLAVDVRAALARHGGDASAWLPPSRAFRCAYVARQIAVKAKYHLSVTAAERSAMTGVLAGCPGQRVPVS